MSYHELRVARIVEETHDTRSFVLEFPPELTDRFGYRAGQYLTFEVLRAARGARADRARRGATDR